MVNACSPSPRQDLSTPGQAGPYTPYTGSSRRRLLSVLGVAGSYREPGALFGKPLHPFHGGEAGKLGVFELDDLVGDGGDVLDADRVRQGNLFVV